MRKYSYATHAKATKTHVLKFLIHEKNGKNSCAHMRKFGKTHMLIHEKNGKTSCAHMRKCCKTHICDYMRKTAKNHSLIYAKTCLRICEKSLKFICKIHVEIHLYL